MMDHQIKVETSFSEAGLIEQVIGDSLATEHAGFIMKRVMDTAEADIREALIGLGWTPPGEGIAGRSSGHTVGIVDADGQASEDAFEHNATIGPETQPRKKAPRINR
jgi:hypothetical protein